MTEKTATSQEVTTVREAPLPAIVEDAVPILDSARFEHMQRIAQAMAFSSLIPETLRKVKEEGQMVDLPRKAVVANIFRIVNQAVRWNMDPFAVVDHCSVVHGRLMFEGKLVHAIVDARLGIRLNYVFGRMVETKLPGGGKVLKFDPTEEGAGETLAVQVVGQFPDEDAPRTIEGTVSLWKTDGKNTPWGNPLNFKRQLRYRGAREWTRAHAPGVLLGVLTNDEIDHDVERQERVTSTRRKTREKVDIVGKLAGDKAKEGFDQEKVIAETGEEPVDAQAEEITPEPAQEETPHNPETGEVIEGEVVSSQTEDAPTETDQKQDEDGLEELGMTAFEDGYQGEPVEAILSECQTDREREIAAQEHERGRLARIEKEAKEHAASQEPAEQAKPETTAEPKTEPEPEMEDVAGPAPKGVKYCLAGDEPDQKGRVPVYVDGAKFSDFGVAAAIKGGIRRYDAHPEPADPRLASEGGGTLAKEKPAETTAEETPTRSPVFLELAAIKTWIDAKKRLATLYGTDDFKALDPLDQAATRARLWEAIAHHKEADPKTDPSAFSVWADFRALTPEAVPAIRETFEALMGSAAFERMKDEQKTTLKGRVDALLARIEEN